MDIWSIIVIAARRWYVTVPALLIVALVVFRVADTVRPTAQATGTLALLSPSSVPVDDGPGDEADDEPELAEVNPYLYFSSSLMSVADILRQTADAPAFRSALQEQGLDAQYEIGVERTSPVVAMSSQTDDPAVAVETVNTLMEQLQDELQTLQEEAGAPEHAWIQTRVVAQSREAQLLQTNRLRVIASVAALGLVAAVAVALVVETASAAIARRNDPTASTGSGRRPLRRWRQAGGGNGSLTADGDRRLVGASRRGGGGYGVRRRTDE